MKHAPSYRPTPGFIEGPSAWLVAQCIACCTWNVVQRAVRGTVSPNGYTLVTVDWCASDTNGVQS